MIEELDILLRLLIAHVIGDFILQPRSWVEQRNRAHWRSPYLYLHGLIHAILAWLAAGDVSLWWVPVIMIVTHTAIDLIKSYKQEGSARWFVIDQLLHVIVILGIWWWLSDPGLLDTMKYHWFQPGTLAIILGVVVLTTPTGHLISSITSRWAGILEDRSDNLPSAGTYIGIIERLLILLFIMLDAFEAVGFLLAAKSVFRFGDLTSGSDRKRTEYVLIGTFLSFGIAIFIGMMIMIITKA